jgi:repressor LexA
LFSVPAEYILGSSDNRVLFPIKKGIKIPVLGRVPAGIPVEAVESVIGWEEIPVEWTSSGEVYFGLVVRGNSMMPKYLEDDTVIIKKQECCESGQDAVVIVDGNDATLKKVIYTDQGVILQPLNSEYSPMFYSKDEIETKPVIILGIVVELRRKII